MLLLKDLIKEFEFDMQIKKFTTRTIKTAINSTKAFTIYCKKEFNADKLEDITHLHIKKYISYMQGLGRTEVYLNSILKYLRMFYRYCMQENYITKEQNPVLKVNWVKEPKIVIETFTNAEAKRMLEQWNYRKYHDARNKAIIATFFETGIRNLELCNICTTDVRDRVILIHGKGNKERYVPISPALKKTLIKFERIREGYIKNKKIEEDAYFLSYRGRRLTVEAVQVVVRKTGEMAKVRKNIRCSPHTIRHYYAQFMLKNEVDIYTLSRLMGHQDTQITKRYLQSIKDSEIVEMSVNISPLMLLNKNS
ncbi:tyrosine-type recombinase/integrase [Clostridium tetani]|uniref:tyrosine-type recombinase/integrase n=1 Tax=Clostridium tetani TaxID=1513 RepID=UPI000657580A|nr:tyrosine-type recombinase/integrase [Clostridium tetani]